MVNAMAFKKYCEVESEDFSIQIALIKQEMTKHH